MQKSDRWDRKYLLLARYVAENWSKDPSTKVGAVLVNYEYGLEFIGYNGFAHGVEDTLSRISHRDTKYAMTVHAEVNAILKAGHFAKNSTLYVWPSFAELPICHDCAKFAIQAGVAEIVGVEPDTSSELYARWRTSIEIAKTMLDEAGVTHRCCGVD